MNVSRETFHAAMKECKRGETLQVTIETATADGTGIARVDGQVVFVPGTLPGEVCKICIAHIGRSAVFAELLRVAVGAPRGAGLSLFSKMRRLRAAAYGLCAGIGTQARARL